MTVDQKFPSADLPVGEVRELTARDLDALWALIDTDPDAYCVVAERITIGGLNPQSSGGPTWGWFVNGRLRSAIYVGANLTPIDATPAALAAFGVRLRDAGRRSSAIVGYREDVLSLWQMLEPTWGPCRELRADQPLMVMNETPLVSGDPQVEVVSLTQLDALMPAAIAMFTEEVGVSPILGGRGPAYRARVATSVMEGKSYAILREGEVVFKAEIGAVSRGCAQLQGVWVHPAMRRTGIAVAAVAAVSELAREHHAPRLSLYANHHNSAALHTYRRVGFRQVATFATVLF